MTEQSRTTHYFVKRQGGEIYIEVREGAVLGGPDEVAKLKDALHGEVDRMIDALVREEGATDSGTGEPAAGQEVVQPPA